MPIVRRILLLACVLAVGALVVAVSGAVFADSPRHPWPFGDLQLGLASPAGDATALARSAPFGLRYQYLSAGVNTGNSWQTWGNGHGTYVNDYIAESERSHLVPVFSYYQLRQSAPGAAIGDESTADLTNLENRRTMRAYYLDLRAFFEHAARATGPVVLQVEPDLWGYIEQQARHNSAASVAASVASSGIPLLHRLPNTAAGFAQAVLVLRDHYAPHVIVGYHDSIWGSGKDIRGSHPTDLEVDQMAARSVEFYRSLHAHYDVLFSEFADRDAGFAQNVDGEGTSQWWDKTDFTHDVRYLSDVHSQLHLATILWQIPLGNTVMRALNNTPYHYQDNRVQTLLSPAPASRRLLRAYVHAGVVALLFGSGQPTDTCACDAAHDGVTNPPPIDGNRRLSVSADDDGGYFRERARAYYRHPLPRS
jgi:hypothetical protein